ncbi:hypothetical protein VTL71DRAFT_8649 [Oculimacula yallundae]|uniref:BZIP domain-containing protein n=1 Tax=Oculimacula yallundae TaxID=86028 RepID=A0ABR4CYB0_9HELO
MARPSIHTSPQPKDTTNLEWNVFEQQFLTWHNQSSTSHTISSRPHRTTASRSGMSYYPYTASSSQHVEADSQSPGSSVADEKIEDRDMIGLKKEPTRRRIQNRKAQRAFRLRQKTHVESLEEKLHTLMGDYEELQRRYTCLSIEYERDLRVRGEDERVRGVGSGDGYVKIEGMEDCEGENEDVDVRVDGSGLGRPREWGGVFR